MYRIFGEIDRIFEDAWGSKIYYVPPSGYELTEYPDHKKNRIEGAINATKNMISYHEGQIKQLQDKLSEKEKELLALNL
jgi:hypothetical protein